MDDLIVIILTLVVAVIGIINQQKKKKTVPNQPGGVTKQPADFWDMIMEAQSEQAEYEPEYVEQPTKVEKFEEPEVKPQYQFVTKREGIFEDKSETKEVTKKELRATIDGEKFSLRKAVIYSEILNRKYS